MRVAYVGFFYPSSKETMSEFANSICIAFPANYPDTPEAHCTLIWLGYVDTFMATKEQVLAVLNSFDYTPNVQYRTLPPKIFGKDDERVVVLPLDDSDGSLQRLRTHLEDALLGELQVRSPSEYTTYVPHVTVEDFVPGVTRLFGYRYPDSIALSAPELWWGDEHLN